ncbi:MAG: hypothetical protein ABEJ66_00060 [Candidatus Nanohaloarchaea archaeon]
MTEFERELVNAFNDFFEEEDIDGIAHRKKQHRFSSQLCDVLVDSEHEMFYLAIENKSVKEDSTNKAERGVRRAVGGRQGELRER